MAVGDESHRGTCETAGYRYEQQWRSSGIVCAHERAFEQVVWSKFGRLHIELKNYFEDVELCANLVSDDLIMRRPCRPRSLRIHL